MHKQNKKNTKTKEFWIIIIHDDHDDAWIMANVFVLNVNEQCIVHITTIRLHACTDLWSSWSDLAHRTKHAKDFYRKHLLDKTNI